MKIGFIGAGNMGGALAKAVRAALPDCEIYISDMSTEKAAALAAVLKGKAVSNERIASECDFVFFGVKPSALAVMISGIKDTFKHRKNDFTIVSMAAGATMKSLARRLVFRAQLSELCLTRLLPSAKEWFFGAQMSIPAKKPDSNSAKFFPPRAFLTSLMSTLSTPDAPFPAAAPRLHICL